MKNIKSRVKMKHALAKLSSSLIVIAPIATLVACSGVSKNQSLDGGKEQANNNLSKNFFEPYNQFALTKIDVLNQVVNSKDYGFLDLTLLNTHEWAYNTNTDVFTEGSINNEESYIKIAVKDTVPIYEKEILKTDITSGSYKQVSKEINDLIVANPSERLGIYATQTAKDIEGTDELYKSGKYKIKVFKMKNDGDYETKLNSAIDMLKSDKFAPAIEMIKAQQAYNIPRLMNYYVKSTDPSNSFARNGRESLLSEDIPANISKDSVVWRDFQNGEAVPTLVNNNNFKHGSIALLANFATTKNFDFINGIRTLQNVHVHASVEHSRKDEVMNLVLTITYNEGRWEAMATDVDATKDFRIHTIRIPMPNISNFASSETTDLSLTKDLLINKLNVEFIQNLVNSFKGNMIMLDQQRFDEAKILILEIISRIQFISKATKLLSNDAALNSFISWAKTKYLAFDLSTFNKFLQKTIADSINRNTIISAAITGMFPPSLFTFLGEMNKFYDLLERFVHENQQFNIDA